MENKTREEKKNDYEKQIAQLFIEGIKTGTAPWQKPWKPGRDYKDFNMFTMNKDKNQSYQGMNSLILALTRTVFLKTNEPRWTTWVEMQNYNKKIKDPKERLWIKKGEEGTIITYYGLNYFDKDGKKLDPTAPDFDKEKVDHSKRVFKPACVFNISQLGKLTFDENGNALKDENNKLIYRPAFEPLNSELYNNNIKDIEKADELIKNIGVNIIHDQGDRCFYQPIEDAIHMTDKKMFNSTSDYYDTLFHELTHWTGHSSRLNREEAEQYGTDIKARAKEELIAEIGGFMLCQENNIEFNPSNNNIAYVKSWISELENKPESIFEACQKAKVSTNFINELSETKKDENQVVITKLEDYDKTPRKRRN